MKLLICIMWLFRKNTAYEARPKNGSSKNGTANQGISQEGLFNRMMFFLLGNGKKKRPEEVKPENGNSRNQSEYYGCTKPSFVRILYSRHNGHNANDFVAQLFEELLKECKKYDKVYRDRKDCPGTFTSYIQENIDSPNCKLLIIFAKDSFDLRNSENTKSGHGHFYEEIKQCVKCIKDKKKEGMFVFVYLKDSTAETSFLDLQNHLTSKIDVYEGKGEEIMNLIQTQQAIDCMEPNGDDAYDLYLRDLYKDRLKFQLKNINII